MNSLLQLFGDLLVNSITEVLHSALPMPEYHGGGVVWRLASWFGVHADQIKVFPHLFDELVDIKPFVGGNRNAVRDFVYKVEFLDGDYINLVQDLDRHQTNQRQELNCSHINGWHVDPREGRVRQSTAGQKEESPYLLPSITSTRSSAVAPGWRIAISALLILYSLHIAWISSWSIFVRGTVFVIASPPLSFFRTMIAGGFLFSRMPKPSSSDSMIFLSPRGLRTSRTMNMRLHVRATGVFSYQRHVSIKLRCDNTCDDYQNVNIKEMCKYILLHTLSTSPSAIVRTFDDPG